METRTKHKNYEEYLKIILKTISNSWLEVEYYWYKNGFNDKTVDELEQILVETLEKEQGIEIGTFDDLLTGSGMTRGEFESMYKEYGFDTEEEYLKSKLLWEILER